MKTLSLCRTFTGRSLASVAAFALLLLPVAGRAQLVSETFSSSAANFTAVAGGTWSVSGGKYVLTNPATGGVGQNGNLAVHSTTLAGDWTLTVDASVTATAAAWDDFSIVFGYQNATNYYYVSFNESNDANTSGLFKVAGGVATQLADITSLISGGTTYAVKVQKTGNTYKAYRNNVLLATATDSAYPSGKAGFGTRNDGASFDTLVVNVSGSVTATAGGGFQNTAMTAQTGAFTSTFLAAAPVKPADAIIGLAPATATSHTALAAIVRFNASGNIDARNGSTYAALLTLPYSAGAAYAFRVVVNVPAHTYSVHVTPPGGSEQTLASNYAFRTEQSAVTSLNTWTVHATNPPAGTSLTVANFALSGSQQAVAAPGFNPGGGAYSSAQSVAISTATSGATIRYTLDGSTPSANHGTVYSAPVAIAATATLKAIAYKTGMVDSAITAATYTINGTGNNYYCDPVNGSMSNPGTLASPWSTLQAVFAAGKIFSAGDRIYLRSGDHGYPQISTANTGNVTITKYASENPVVNRIRFHGSARWWVLDGVLVYTTSAPPETPVLTHPVYPKSGNWLVTIEGSSADITLQNCTIRSIDNASSWTANDWNNKAWNGINARGSAERITVDACYLKNVNFGIEFGGGSHHVAKNSTVENFCGDGIRPLCNYGVVEYNVIKNCYDVNGNHHDAIQSYTNGSGGIGSSELVYGVIRGNLIINATSNYPLRGDTQGIGLFDGWYDFWTIENNVVVIDDAIGIAIWGARDSRIANNTVVKNPQNFSSVHPEIRFNHHKTRGDSVRNLIVNNIAFKVTAVTHSSNTIEHNLTNRTDYTNIYLNYNASDFHLKSGSPAIGYGTTAGAPTIDRDKNTRSAPYDAGAYEF